MHEIRTEIDIDATAEKVWTILTDFAAYSQWNPFMRSVAGTAATGERLTVAIAPEGGKGMTFRPRVLTADPHQVFRWMGRLVMPGLFDGEHYFRIEPLGPDRVRFIQGEKFSGILVPLFKANLEKGTRGGFAAMNAALKARAEQASAP